MDEINFPDAHQEIGNFLRLPEILRRNGEGRAKCYAQIKVGLYPPPIKIGIKTSVWLETEDLLIRAARISGKSDEEIREIVRALVAARSQAFANALSESRVPVRQRDGDAVHSLRREA